MIGVLAKKLTHSCRFDVLRGTIVRVHIRDKYKQCYVLNTH